jgi:hypothetical protein
MHQWQNHLSIGIFSKGGENNPYVNLKIINHKQS